MTSTGTFTAAGVNKPTSRVLAPPGGSSNISFGGYGSDEKPQKTSQKPEVQREEPVGQNQQDLYNPNPPQPIRPAVGNNPVTGAPNVTGAEPVAEAPTEGGAKGRNAKPDRIDPASMPAAGGRVENKAAMKRQPPGGRDSGIFS